MLDTESTVSIICRHIPEVQAVYLFGSAADCEIPVQELGDVDPGLLLPPGRQRDRFRLMLSSLGLPVDLADLRGAATCFAMEVIHTGKRIHVADQHAADTFEMLTLSAYQKLNLERADILSDILRSGQVVQLCPGLYPPGRGYPESYQGMRAVN